MSNKKIIRGDEKMSKKEYYLVMTARRLDKIIRYVRANKGAISLHLEDSGKSWPGQLSLTAETLAKLNDRLGA